MREHVRDRYARTARTLEDAPDGTPPSLGVGDPVALADLKSGETVLDLGSGPGRDLLAAAEAVGAPGRAIGVDMTPDMVERARRIAPANASVLEGDLERLPLPCGAVDVVISNCVINLVGDKRRALVEAFRVLAPGGRLAVVDTAFESEPPPEVRADPEAWACCVGGALVVDDYTAMLDEIGFADVHLEVLDAGCGGEACSYGEATTRSVAVTARKPGTPEVSIRPAVPADRDAIESLVSAASLPVSGLRTEDALVALEDGRVAGAGALERYGKAALLRSLIVDPERRRNGIGNRLVVAALEVARWSGAEEVFLLTTGAQAYFEGFGFVPVSRTRAAAACPSGELRAPECADAVAMRLSFEEADLPLLGRPSRKELPTFQSGSCC